MNNAPRRCQNLKKHFIKHNPLISKEYVPNLFWTESVKSNIKYSSS